MAASRICGDKPLLLKRTRLGDAVNPGRLIVFHDEGRIASLQVVGRIRNDVDVISRATRRDLGATEFFVDGTGQHYTFLTDQGDVGDGVVRDEKPAHRAHAGRRGGNGKRESADEYRGGDDETQQAIRKKGKGPDRRNAADDPGKQRKQADHHRKRYAAQTERDKITGQRAYIRRFVHVNVGHRCSRLQVDIDIQIRPTALEIHETDDGEQPIHQLPTTESRK